MADDLVVDANVWGHAVNPLDKFWRSALEFVTALGGNDSVLAFDNVSGGVGDFDKSLLYVEYRTFVTAPGIANQMFNLVVSQNRFVFHEKVVGRDKQICKRLVPRNHRDEVILGVAVQTISKVLVSNDYSDFHKKARRKISRELGVTVVDSSEAA